MRVSIRLSVRSHTHPKPGIFGLKYGKRYYDSAVIQLCLYLCLFCECLARLLPLINLETCASVVSN